MRYFLLIVAVVMGQSVLAADKKPLIADPILEKSIRRPYSLNKPKGELTKADLEKVLRLSLDNNKLTKLPEGLEKLTQLKELTFGNNQLTDVKGLKKLTQLKVLVLYDNKLTNVKGLEKLTHLTELWLDGNKLTNVKGLENLTQLKYLYLDDNKLTDVKGLEKLTQLTYLRVDRSQLTDVKGLKKFTKLEALNLQDNPDLTKAQIAELQKALPKCKILSNPTK
jgi:Leucine-rich repeat (LRR) protein